jgi:TatD DNase family protein
MLIDTHCHLTAPEFAHQLPDVLDRAREAGVTRLITVAQEPDDARAVLDLVRQHPNLYAAVGVHPHEAGKRGTADLDAIRAMLRGKGPGSGLAPRIVAVGETGLDFYYDFATPQRQEQVFRTQLEMAQEVARPVVIHARESETRVCEILAEYPRLAGRVVFHCFSAEPTVARRALDLGCFLSFTGVVTFRKKAGMIRESARLVPLDRLMVETDAPYLSPEPVRKIRPNEPALMVHIARCLAELRGEDEAAFAAATTANAIRFFNLPEGES